MKKMVVVLLVLGCSFLGGRLCAEYIAQNDISLMRLQKVFSARYGTVIDGDTLRISAGSQKALLEIENSGKTKVLCFYGYYSKIENESTQNMVILANKWNQKKRFLRVVIDEDSDICCDYYFVCVGGIQSENLLEMMEWYFDLMGDLEQFIVNGGEKVKK